MDDWMKQENISFFFTFKKMENVMKELSKEKKKKEIENITSFL